MNTNAPLNAAKTALAPTGKPVYFASVLETNGDGLLQPPQDATFYVLHLIVGAPNFEWGTERYGLVSIRVDAWSTVEGQARAMLQTATPLLIAARFTPGPLVDLGRYRTLTGAGQTWERNE